MEPVKHRDQFFEPDIRHSMFVLVDTTTGAMRATTIDDHYGDLDGLDLNPGVPEPVVSYINVVKNLYLYGWLCYPFFTVCHTQSAMAVELALRLKIPDTTGTVDKRTLKPLLQQAIAKGLITDAGFPRLPAKQAEARRFYEELEQMGIKTNVQSSVPFVKVLEESLPDLRNEFAHPHDMWIVTPGPALESINLAVEIVNQLWT